MTCHNCFYLPYKKTRVLGKEATCSDCIQNYRREMNGRKECPEYKLEVLRRYNSY